MKMYLWSIIFMAIIAGISHANTIEVTTPHVEAAATSTAPYETDICGLYAVICEDEESVTKALTDIPHESETTSKVIRYLYEEAPKRGINPDTVAHTIYCESMFYNIQSGHIRKDGTRENSWGIAQIFLDAHNVTKQQATDSIFAIDWMLENWHTAKWYGYDRATDTCTNSIKEYWL